MVFLDILRQITQESLEKHLGKQGLEKLERLLNKVFLGLESDKNNKK